MTTSLIICSLVLVVILVLWVKAKIASKKVVSDRSSVDKILVSLFVMGKKNLDDAADSIRTPEISKEEAIQKTKEALGTLERDYKEQVRQLFLTKARLEEKVLPDLKVKPGKYLAKAQKNKRDYEETLKKVETTTDPDVKERFNSLAMAYQQSAKSYLMHRKKALDRIEKCKNTILSITSNISMFELTYDSRKVQLDEILTELETTVTSNLSAVKFNSNMELIKSLKRETADKLREQNAIIQADQSISGMDDDSNIEAVGSDFDDEFEALK